MIADIENVTTGCVILDHALVGMPLPTARPSSKRLQKGILNLRLISTKRHMQFAARSPMALCCPEVAALLLTDVKTDDDWKEDGVYLKRHQ